MRPRPRGILPAWPSLDLNETAHGPQRHDATEHETESREARKDAADPTGRSARPRRSAAPLDQGHTQPDDGVAFIRSAFGLEMTKQHFSAAKSQIKLKARRGKLFPDAVPAKRGRKPKVQGAAPSSSAAPGPSRNNGEADLLAAIEAMKPLVAALGSDKVKRIADLLG